jgi:hypothetical protein
MGGSCAPAAAAPRDPRCGLHPPCAALGRLGLEALCSPERLPDGQLSDMRPPRFGRWSGPGFGVWLRGGGNRDFCAERSSSDTSPAPTDRCIGFCTERAACSRIANNTDASLAVAHLTKRKSGEQSASRATARKLTGSPLLYRTPILRARIQQLRGEPREAAQQADRPPTAQSTRAVIRELAAQLTEEKRRHPQR